MLEELVAQPNCIHVHVKSCNKICLNYNKITYIPATHCLRVLNVVSKNCLDNAQFLSALIHKSYQI